MARGKKVTRAMRRNDAAASSSLSRKEQQEVQEKEMEKQVQTAMNKFSQQKRGEDGKREKAHQAACVRSMLMHLREQCIEMLPRFEIDIDCIDQELDTCFDDREFRFQLVASLFIAEGVVATPPKTFLTFQLIDIMEKYLDEHNNVQKRSIFQFITQEFDDYFSAFRPTPPGENPYKPGGFFAFGGTPLPSFFGDVNYLDHPESYRTVTEVELRGGFMRLMVERLHEHFTTDNYKDYIIDRHCYLEAAMVLFGECQRSAVVRELVRGTEEGPFGMITDAVDRSYEARVSNVTLAMDKLFHHWSALSKVGLWLLAAIIELDLGLENEARVSFTKGRIKLRRCSIAMNQGIGRVPLQVYDSNGIFSLKKLFGCYLRLVKYEEKAVIRCIMRSSKIGFSGTYDRRTNSQENIRLLNLWDTQASDKDSESENPDKLVDKQLIYHGDKVEWQRWRQLKAELKAEPGDRTLLAKFME